MPLSNSQFQGQLDKILHPIIVEVHEWNLKTGHVQTAAGRIGARWGMGGEQTRRLDEGRQQVTESINFIANQQQHISRPLAALLLYYFAHLLITFTITLFRRRLQNHGAHRAHTPHDKPSTFYSRGAGIRQSGWRVYPSSKREERRCAVEVPCAGRRNRLRYHCTHRRAMARQEGSRRTKSD